MKILKQGVKKPEHHWAGKKYLCSKCDTVMELDDGDVGLVINSGGNYQGDWVEIICPVCGVERTLSDCAALVEGACRV